MAHDARLRTAGDGLTVASNRHFKREGEVSLFNVAMWNCLLQLCKECLAKERLYSATKRYIEKRQSSICLTYLSSRYTFSHVELHRATEKSWFGNPGFYFHTVEEKNEKVKGTVAYLELKKATF